MVELTVRLIVSLSLVLGLLLLLARFGGRRFRGNRDSLVRIIHRQNLSRSSTVSVVAVGSRVLVLGTTEQQVRVLTELDPEEIAEESTEATVLSLVDEAPDPDDADDAETFDEVLARASAAAPAREAHPAAVTGRTGGALAGSVLSLDTWRQALTVVKRRSS